MDICQEVTGNCKDNCSHISRNLTANCDCNEGYYENGVAQCEPCSSHDILCTTCTPIAC